VQNFVSGWTGLRQSGLRQIPADGLVARTPTEVPHVEQNFAPSSKVLPHEVQFAAASDLS
jgi:hypothetical protein